MKDIIYIYNQNGRKPLDVVLLNSEPLYCEGYGEKGMKATITDILIDGAYYVVSFSYTKFEAHNVPYETDPAWQEHCRDNVDMFYIDTTPEAGVLESEFFDLAESDPVFEAYERRKQDGETYFQFLVREYREKILKT